MKKLFFFPVALFSFAVSAQTMSVKDIGTGLAVVPNGTVSASTTADGNTKIDFDIKNTTASAKHYNVKRYDILLHSSGNTTADAYFCFGGNCYPDVVTTSPNYLVLQPGKSASDTTAAYYVLTTDLDEASSVGLSVVRYTFFNVDQVSDSMQITIKYNGSVGINTISKDVASFDIFPNPASENAALKINANSAFDSKLIVYNSLGAVVSEKSTYINAGKNSIDLKIENFSPGLYFVNLKNGDASVTKRLIVK